MTNPSQPPFWEKRRGGGPVTEWIEDRKKISEIYAGARRYNELSEQARQLGFKLANESAPARCARLRDERRVVAAQAVAIIEAGGLGGVGVRADGSDGNGNRRVRAARPRKLVGE